MNAVRIERCEHDMEILDGHPTCAICLKQPDVPSIDDDDFISHSRRQRPYIGPHVDRRWLDTGRFKPECNVCVRCSEPITTPDDAVWSIDDGGLIGKCCEDEAA